MRRTIVVVLALVLLVPGGVMARGDDTVHPGIIPDGKWCARMLPGKKMATARKRCVEFLKSIDAKASRPPWEPVTNEADYVLPGALVRTLLWNGLKSIGIDDGRAWIAWEYAEVGAGHEPETVVPTRSVVVAADFIPAGEAILPRHLTLREVAIDKSYAFAFTDPAEAAGTVAAISIMAAQPITPYMLSSDAALDALSDAEHYGVFVGHAMELPPRLLNVLELGAVPTVPEMEGGLEGWLAEAVTDLATMVGISAVAELFEDELAWLEAHPPRPCWADVHESWRGGAEHIAATFRSLASAVFAQDPEALMQVYPDLEGFFAAMPNDFFSAQTCWHVPSASPVAPPPRLPGDVTSASALPAARLGTAPSP